MLGGRRSTWQFISVFSMTTGNRRHGFGKMRLDFQFTFKMAVSEIQERQKGIHSSKLGSRPNKAGTISSYSGI